MKFNPPPTWPPFPPDWSPTPDWKPDPSWPPAPTGWTFWTEDESNGRGSRQSFVHRIPWSLGLVALVTAAVVGIMSVFALTQLDIRTLEQTATLKQTFVLRPDVEDIYADLAAWQRFGDIQVAASPDGRSAVLESRTGETRWAGVKLPGGHTCGLRVAGRVRDSSHSPGVPGGFGFGLAEVNGLPESATLTGSAVQYDAGRGGYRLTQFPAQTRLGLLSRRRRS